MTNDRIYVAVPDTERKYVSVNVLLAQKARMGDGARKVTDSNSFPDGYYNMFYKTRIIKRCSFHKSICIKYLAGL